MTYSRCERHSASSQESKAPALLPANERAVLLDWFLDVAQEFAFRGRTVFVAAAVLDRFLSSQNVPTGWLQLLGSACLWIAAKAAEPVAPSARDILSLTEDAFTQLELLQMERNVLAVVEQPLQQPTVFDHTSRLLHAASCEERFGLPGGLFQEVCLSCFWEQCEQLVGPSSSENAAGANDPLASHDSLDSAVLRPTQPDRGHMRLMHVARMVAEASLLSAPVQEHASSEVAAACVLIARLMTGKPAWTPGLAHDSGIAGPSAIPQCLAAVYDAYTAARSSPDLQAVKHRYSGRRMDVFSMEPTPALTQLIADCRAIPYSFLEPPPTCPSPALSHVLAAYLDSLPPPGTSHMPLDSLPHTHLAEPPSYAHLSALMPGQGGTFLLTPLTMRTADPPRSVTTPPRSTSFGVGAQPPASADSATGPQSAFSAATLPAAVSEYLFEQMGSLSISCTNWQTPSAPQTSRTMSASQGDLSSLQRQGQSGLE